MVFIQRRTVTDALIAEDGLAVTPRRAGADITAAANNSGSAIRRGVSAATLPSVPDLPFILPLV
jgi:hypothetical protein